MKKLHMALVIGVIATVFLNAYSDFNGQCEEIRQNTLRLHVLANSDSDEDQAVKYGVRDALLLHGEEIFGQTTSREEAEREITGRLDEIEAIAATELERRSVSAPVKAELVSMFFTTRQYGDITVPAGRYHAVRVTIGEGRGRNWWCVMFPPMCVPAVMEDDGYTIEQQLEELGTRPEFKPKFAVVELFETIKNKIEGEPETVIAAGFQRDSIPLAEFEAEPHWESAAGTVSSYIKDKTRSE